MTQHPLITRLHSLKAYAAPGQVALIDNGGKLSYRDLVDRVVALGTWLRDQEVRVVALYAANSIDWVVLDLACQVAELICLPLPQFFSDEQLQHCLQSTSVDLIFAESGSRSSLLDGCGFVHHKLDCPSFLTLDALRLATPDYQQATPAYPACTPLGTQKITFTSGSTGAPKGVCLSQEHQWRVAESLAERIAIKRPQHLCLLPLATLLENIAGVYTPLLCGGTVILPDARTRGLSGSSGLDSQRLLDCVSHYQPDSLILIPQLLSTLLVAGEAGWQVPTSLKFVAVGGGKVDPEIIIQARRFGIPVYEGYGLSECGSVVALNTPAEDKPGAVGKPLSHCEVTIENSEIIVSGACHLGYLGQSESWFPRQIATGDLGSLEDGWLSIHGRANNLLISSFGRNVSPEWVESALNARPLLTQCVVVGDGRPYLSALLSAPAIITDTMISEWVNRVNQQLPDYAQVQAWRRLDQDAWQGLLTINGRPRRELICARFADVIGGFYASDVGHAGSLKHQADVAI